MTRRHLVAALLVIAVLSSIELSRRAPANPILHSVTIGQGAGALLLDAPAHRAIVVSGDGRSVGVVDTQTGALMHPVHIALYASYEPPGAMVVDARTARVFTIDVHGASIHVFDAHSGALLRTVDVGPNAVALTVDVYAGRVFVVNSALHAGEHGRVSMLDADSGRLLRTVPVGDIPHAIAVDRHLHRILVAYTSPRVSTLGVSVLDAGSGRLLRTIAVGHSAASVPSPAGLFVDRIAGRAYMETKDGVGILDMQRGRLMRTVGGRMLAMDPFRGRLFVVAPDQTVRVVDAHSGRVTHHGALLLRPVGAIVDEGTGTVVVGTGRGVQVVDGRTGSVQRTIDAGQTSYLSDVDERRGLALLIAPATFDSNSGAFT